jgi:cysteine sulfinate desulfinase/cysteine desulfurase-like protein
LVGAINQIRKEKREKKTINIVITAIEHPSITYWCDKILPLFPDLRLSIVKPTSIGEITPEYVMEHVTPDTDIVSIITRATRPGS